MTKVTHNAHPILIQEGSAKNWGDTSQNQSSCPPPAALISVHFCALCHLVFYYSFQSKKFLTFENLPKLNCPFVINSLEQFQMIAKITTRLFLSNFSYYLFFRFWILIVSIYWIWETSRNKLKKHSVTKNCSNLSLFE